MKVRPRTRRVRRGVAGPLRGVAGLANALARVSRTGEKVATEHGAPGGSPRSENVAADKLLRLELCGLCADGRASENDGMCVMCVF